MTIQDKLFNILLLHRDFVLKEEITHKGLFAQCVFKINENVSPEKKILVAETPTISSSEEIKVLYLIQNDSVVYKNVVTQTEEEFYAAAIVDLIILAVKLFN